MKTRMIAPIAAILILAAANAALAQGTAFTYQGRLKDSGQDANGSYDLRFAVYDGPSNGNLVAGPLTNSATGVIEGLFTVTLDFGGGVFTGPARWLEIAARTNGGAGFITLSPRQELTPTPYAVMANASSNLLGTVSATQLKGAVASSGLAGTYSGQLTLNNPLNNLCGNGSCLTGVNAALLDGLGATNFWQLAGNAGTTPGVNFLGTIDNNSLLLKVNDGIAIRYDPAPYAPNVVAGLAAIKPTLISSNVSGAVVAGGGAPSSPVTGYGAGDYFAIFDNDGTIGGGFGNKVGTDNGDPTDAAFATVSGGVFNSAGNYAATVAGGDANAAMGMRAAVLGGFGNQAWGSFSAIGGGLGNFTRTNASYSAVGGGQQNSIGDSFAFIGGGTNNTIQSGSPASTIGGGHGNVVDTDSLAAVVGGGEANIVGGQYATVGGGYFNIATNVGATVAGGEYNIASGIGAVVAGGGYDGVVAGNLASGNASVVGGGDVNTASGTESTVGGGEYNTASGPFSTVSGGNVNVASGRESTIPGGYHNVASGQYSFAAGYNANAANSGAFVWSDGTGTLTSSTTANSVTFRGSGGYQFFTGTGATGVQLAPGATAWSTISDRKAKKNIEPLDYEAVLQKLAHVPVAQWNYNWEPDDAVPHIGPMAQDFKKAFYPGRDDKSITTLEFDGVELAAIEGLNLKLQQQDAELKNQMAAQARELEAKERAIQSLEERLDHLERDLSRSDARR